MHCVGTLDDTPCEHGAVVDLRGEGAGWEHVWEQRGWYAAASEALERLHLDHERPLHQTCHRWRERLC